MLIGCTPKQYCDMDNGRRSFMGLPPKTCVNDCNKETEKFKKGLNCSEEWCYKARGWAAMGYYARCIGE